MFIIFTVSENKCVFYVFFLLKANQQPYVRQGSSTLARMGVWPQTFLNFFSLTLTLYTSTLALILTLTLTLILTLERKNLFEKQNDVYFSDKCPDTV